MSSILFAAQLLSAARNSSSVHDEDGRGQLVALAVERSGRLQVSGGIHVAGPIASNEGIFRDVDEVVHVTEDLDAEGILQKQKLVDKAWRIWFVNPDDPEDPGDPDGPRTDIPHHPFFVNEELIPKISKFAVPLVWLQAPMRDQMWPIGDPTPCEPDNRLYKMYKDKWDVAGGELPFGWLAFWKNDAMRMPKFNKDKSLLETLPPGHIVYQSIFDGSTTRDFPTQNIVQLASQRKSQKKEEVFIIEHKGATVGHPDMRVYEILSPTKNNTLIWDAGGPYVYETKVGEDKYKFEWFKDREKKIVEQERRKSSYISKHSQNKVLEVGDVCVLKRLRAPYASLNNLQVQLISKEKDSKWMVGSRKAVFELAIRGKPLLQEKFGGNHEFTILERFLERDITAQRNSLFGDSLEIDNPFRITPVQQGPEIGRLEEFRLCNLDKSRKLCTETGPFFGERGGEDCVPPISLEQLQKWYCDQNDFSEATCRFWFYIQCSPVEYRIDPRTHEAKTLYQVMQDNGCANAAQATTARRTFMKSFRALQIPERRIDPGGSNQNMALTKQEFEHKHLSEEHNVRRDEVSDLWKSSNAKPVKSFHEGGGTEEEQFHRFRNYAKSQQELLEEAERLQEKGKLASMRKQALKRGNITVQDLINEDRAERKKNTNQQKRLSHPGVPFGGSLGETGKVVRESAIPAYLWTGDVTNKLTEAKNNLFTTIRTDDLDAHYLSPVSDKTLAILKNVALKDTSYTWDKLTWWEEAGVIMTVEWTLTGIKYNRNKLSQELKPAVGILGQILSKRQCDALVKAKQNIHQMVQSGALKKHVEAERDKEAMVASSSETGIQFPPEWDPCPTAQDETRWIWTPAGVNHVRQTPEIESEWSKQLNSFPEPGQPVASEEKEVMSGLHIPLQRWEVDGFLVDEPRFEWNDVGGITLAKERSRNGKLFHQCLPSESNRQVTLEQRKVMQENGVLPEDYVFEGLFLLQDSYRWTQQAVDDTPRMVNKAATLKAAQHSDVPPLESCPPIHHGLVNSVQTQIFTAAGESLPYLLHRGYVEKEVSYSWTAKTKMVGLPILDELRELLSSLPPMYQKIQEGHAVNSLQLSIIKHNCGPHFCGEANLNNLKARNFVKVGVKVERIVQPEILKQQLQSALIHKYNNVVDPSQRVTFGGYKAEIASKGYRQEVNIQLMTSLVNKDVEESRLAELSLLVAYKKTLEQCGGPCTQSSKLLAPSSKDGVRIYSRPIADSRHLMAPEDILKFDQMFVASAWPAQEDLKHWERNFSLMRAGAYGMPVPRQHGPQAPNLLPRWYKVIFHSADSVEAEGYVAKEMLDNDVMQRYVPVLREVEDYAKPQAGDALLEECKKLDPDQLNCYASNLKKIWKPLSWTDRVLPWMNPILPKPPLTQEEVEQWKLEQDLKFRGIVLMVFGFPIPLDKREFKDERDYATKYNTVMSPSYPFTSEAKLGLHDACEQPGINCAWEEDTGRVAENTGIKLDLTIPYYFPIRKLDNCAKFGDIESGKELCQSHPGAECLLFEETKDFSAATIGATTGTCRCGIQARSQNDPGRIAKCPPAYKDLFEYRKDSEEKIALAISKLAEQQSKRLRQRSNSKL